MNAEQQETYVIPKKKIIDFINNSEGTNHTELDYDYIKWDGVVLKVYMKQFFEIPYKKKVANYYIATKAEIASALSSYIGETITIADFTTVQENGDQTFLEIS